MLLLFAATIFLSASLLFVVQPMVGKMLLPLLGGSPAVWNTCMVFFQAVLLVGYLYAHLLTRLAGRLPQVIVHGLVLAASLALLPIALSEGLTPPRSDFPAAWMLWVLTITAGVPFFVVSTSAPLLQRWFSRTDHPAARDPYFLYAASNAGSMIALLSYPLIVEPSLPLGRQQQWWAWVFGAFALLTIACGMIFLRHAASVHRSDQPRPAPVPAPPLRAAPRARWVLLAFIASSLLMSVTQHLSTDVAAVPLLWVIPLALYLLTFIIGFARGTGPLVTAASWATPLLGAAAAFSFLTETARPAWFFLSLHLVFLFAAALTCHGRLARERPHTAHLTEFYLLIAVGGVLGGIFNALFAPVVFTSLAEYPIGIVLACMVAGRWVLPRGTDASSADSGRWGAAPVFHLVLLVPVALALLVTVAPHVDPAWPRRSMLIGIALGGCLLLYPFAVRMGLGMGMVMLAISLGPEPGGRLLHKERTFFGIHRVTEDVQTSLGYTRTLRILSHGTTRHGIQHHGTQLSYKPTSYFHPNGPIGQVMQTYWDSPEFDEIAIIGLGAGALAGYGQPHHTFTFYEIDPAVERIARNEHLFTYLRDSSAGRIRIELGDARLTLRRAPEGHYDIIVIDAFTSDAIPVHLLTLEAVSMYMSRLEPRGILAVHLSNRYLDLAQIVGRIAQELGLVSYIRVDRDVSPAERFEAKDTSIWVIVARHPANVAAVVNDTRWVQFIPVENTPLWTDTYTDLIRVFKFGN